MPVPIEDDDRGAISDGAFSKGGMNPKENVAGALLGELGVYPYDGLLLVYASNGVICDN